jgi:hypothetical protein
MSAPNQSWADRSSEVTLPGDVLTLSGERGASEAIEELSSADFLEDGWEDEPPSMSFFILGGAPAVARKWGHTVVTRARGIVKRFEDDMVLLGTPGTYGDEISLGYRLPASLDLRPLVGRRIELTLEEEPPSAGRAGQTLTLRTGDDRVWLIARCGAVADVSHTIDGVAVRVSLTPEADGPLVVATPGLDHIVTPRGEARVRIGTSRYVVELVSRDASGRAAYFIADDRLWH